MGPRLRYQKRHCLFYTQYHKVGRAGIVGGGGHGRAKKEKDSRKKSKSWFLSPILFLVRLLPSVKTQFCLVFQKANNFQEKLHLGDCFHQAAHSLLSTFVVALKLCFGIIVSAFGKKILLLRRVSKTSYIHILHQRSNAYRICKYHIIFLAHTAKNYEKKPNCTESNHLQNCIKCNFTTNRQVLECILKQPFFSCH